MTGKGESSLLFNDCSVQVSEILHVPNLAVSLLSVHKIVSNGNTVIFNADGCRILDSKGKELVKCKPENGVYKLCTDFPECMIAESAENDAEIWHRRLGHMSYRHMLKLRNGSAIGIRFKNAETKIKNCEYCLKGKQTRIPFKNSDNESADIWN